MGPEDTRGQSCSRRTRCTMTLIALAGAVWALCFLATAIAEEKMFSIAANGVLETPKTLAQEIAAIEAQIDAIQEAAIAGIPSLLPGSPQRLQGLVKLFSSKELSVNRNEACAFCHMPQTGYQGAFESLNVSSVATPGSVRTRFALRKPVVPENPIRVGSRLKENQGNIICDACHPPSACDVGRGSVQTAAAAGSREPLSSSQLNIALRSAPCRLRLR